MYIYVYSCIFMYVHPPSRRGAAGSPFIAPPPPLYFAMNIAQYKMYPPRQPSSRRGTTDSPFIAPPPLYFAINIGQSKFSPWPPVLPFIFDRC